jgi:hypothetical protein
MSVDGLLGSSTAPASSGAPPALTALILLVLVVGIGWWLFRLSSQRVSEEVVDRRTRSKKYRRLAEADDVSTTLAAAAAYDPGPGLPPEVHVSAVPPVDESGRTLQDRLAELDQALASGRIGSDEHRVLRAALLEGFAGGWSRPGPVPPPTE